MKTAKIERKVEYFPCIGGEIKATNDAQGIVEGYLNYIGNIDFGDDRTMPGAFKKTLADSYARKRQQGLDFLYPYLWNHDYSIPPAGGIFEANEDRKGLYVKVQMNMDTEMGRNLYSSFRSGFLKKQSMGYKAVQVDWVKEEGKSIRNLMEVAVMEGSAVVFPMNDLAQVDTVKRWNAYTRSIALEPTMHDLAQVDTVKRRHFLMDTTSKMKMTPTREKGKSMDIWSKDYAESYMQANQQDWVSDLWNLWYPLRNEILTAFQTGDTPVEDVTKALKQFGEATVAYMQRGVELNISECMQSNDDDTGPMIGMMSSDDNPETKEDKAGRTISTANTAKLKQAADGIKAHVATIHGVLKQASSSEGQNHLSGYQVYGEDDPTPEQKEEEEQPEHKDEPFVDEHTMLHDLTLLLSADNANRGM